MGRKLKISQIKTSACSCESCKSMCARPCWPTPDEAQALIDAGYAKRMMLDAYILDDYEYLPETQEELKKVVYVLCPATRGWSSKEVPWFESIKAMTRRIKEHWIARQLGIKPKFVSVPTHKGCTFRHKGLCRIHDTGLKPLEGRAAHHDNTDETAEATRMHIVGLWKSKKARRLVEAWKEQVGCVS